MRPTSQLLMCMCQCASEIEIRQKNSAVQCRADTSSGGERQDNVTERGRGEGRGGPLSSRFAVSPLVCIESRYSIFPAFQHFITYSTVPNASCSDAISCVCNHSISFHHHSINHPFVAEKEEAGGEQ